MNKRKRIFGVITIHLSLLFTIGIIGTFLSDYLVSINWFGDSVVEYHSRYYDRDVKEAVWGARHYWYNWGCFIFALLSMANGIVKIIEIEEEYTNTKTKL